jgi:hypothetical protein
VYPLRSFFSVLGYNFPSLEAIAPHLEPTASGPSTEWAVRTSRRLQCHVSVGYPEIAATANAPTKTAAVAAATMAATRYNAVVLVSPAGEVLANYRKSHLYYTDETWAHEGKDGFFVGDTSGLGRITMGICTVHFLFFFFGQEARDRKKKRGERGESFAQSKKIRAHTHILDKRSQAWISTPTVSRRRGRRTSSLATPSSSPRLSFF